MPDSGINHLFQPEPEFLRKRVDEYYEVRLKGDWAGRHPLKGKLPDSNSVQLRTNDYLCIANDTRIVEAEVAVLRDGGHGDTASRVWSYHHTDPIKAFEHRLAGLMLAQDAVLTTSGYTANVGLIQSIARPEIPIYMDMKAHMSLWQGAVSALAQPFPFRHNDPNNLESLLQKHGSGIIVVDALYSTDGAIAPLQDFVFLAELYGCVIVVDETHSFGTQGPNGAGLVVALGLADQVHFRTLGMSKAVAARGGAVVCSRRHAEFYRYEAFPSIFSTGVLPHEVAGYDAALDIFQKESWRREKLHENHTELRLGLNSLGYNVDTAHAQIIALESGSPTSTSLLRDELETRGVFGSVFLPPATPPSRCLIRLSVNCNLRNEEIAQVLEVCSDIRERVAMSDWRSTKRRRGLNLVTPLAA